MNPMNICKMIPSRSAHQDLIPLNFVSERHYFPHTFHAFYSYSVNLVTEGYGFLHTTSGDFPIARGDLFFTFPGKQFYVENIDSMVYLYITFVGTRANALAERLHLSPSNMLFRKKEDLISLWETAIQVADASSIDLMSEAILLYTFGNICASESESGEKSSLSFILTVKRYAEEHFTDPGISLLSAAEEFGYSAKYLSEQFKRTFKIGFCNYLMDLRLNHAQKLILDGARSVSEIALLCGFRDPLYFSKVFKKHTGQSPKEAILSIPRYNKKDG